ncbi:MAG: hypothetical protein EOP49_07795 [Sphingobacteriales bacterium]|nr:MAG: hypothetical protein EOP49_07795 [Sphingobacteriales bacterium]
MRLTLLCLLSFLVCGLLAGCANIVPPQGGSKDVTPPALLSVSPADSQLNIRVSRIEMRFNEYVTVNNAASEVTISPILPFPPNVEAMGRRIIVTIPDTLLQDNTTYRVSFGKAIQDIRENNPATGLDYIFSTGAYFDSMKLSGYVVNAATGKRDTGALVVLYDASSSDSIVVRQKPQYAVKADVSGNFRFEGLPGRPLKIFALRDANNNMIYDGADEMIAFLEQTVQPDTVFREQAALFLFSENDSLNPGVAATDPRSQRGLPPRDKKAAEEGFSYTVIADTSDSRKRTFDITRRLDIRFNRAIASLNPARVNLSFDSAGVSIETAMEIIRDSTAPDLARLSADWKENTLYTLRLLKGFAQDSAGTDAAPGRYTFRTRRDDDYAKLQVHIPSQFAGRQFIFELLRDNDTVYHKPVTDTLITFTRLAPGSYSMRIILDKNENGKWDRGDLFGRRQPETVIPYNTPINLKAGWENLIDFEEPRARRGSLPPGRNANPPD